MAETTVRATLYGTRLSPFVEKVARALLLKGIPFATVDLRNPNDLGKWNPTTGKMPVLEVGPEKIYDSTFILRRIDQLKPAPPLFSSDPVRAAQQRQLEDWSDESFYWYLMALRWCEKNTPASIREIAGTAPLLLRPVVSLLLKRSIVKAPKVQGLGRLPTAILVEEIGRHLDDLTILLGSSPFFYSESPSAADLALYGIVSSLCREATPEGEPMIAERPTLLAWRSRVEEATPET